MPSHVIRSWMYDVQGLALHIVFVTGRRYRYDGVPAEAAAAMREAFAKGEFFNAHIRTRYPATRLDDPQPSLFDRSDRPEE